MVITRAKIAINLFEIRMSVHFGVLEIQHGQWKVEWLEMSVSTLFAQWYTLSRPVLKLRQLPFWNIWNHFSPVLTLRSWQSAGLDNVTKKVYECLDIHLPAYAHTHTHTHTHTHSHLYYIDFPPILRHLRVLPQTNSILFLDKPTNDDVIPKC